MTNIKLNKKILLIDDEHVIISLYQDFFATKKGYELVTAMDPVEGFRKTIEEKPDLIVLDLILPKNLAVPIEEEEKNKEHGFKLLERLKNDERTKHIPIVIFSNLMGEADQQRAMSLGASEYLPKTTSLPSELFRTIEKVLGVNK